MTRQVKLGALEAGDVVVSGLSMHEDWTKNQGQSVGRVARVDAARAKGYAVVTFEDGTRTSGHQSQLVEVEIPGV